MHEAGIAMEVLDSIENALSDRPGFRAVRVTLAVGPLQNVDPDSLRFAFETLSAERPACRGAELILSMERPFCTCNACGEGGPVEGWALTCPGCGSKDLVLTGGDDLILQSIEAENESHG